MWQPPAHQAYPLCPWVIFVPLPQTPLAEEILVVQQQLIQACAGDVDQAQLRLTRSGRCAAALANILPATACCLDHLVHGARPFVQEPSAKRVRGIVDHRRRPKRPQSTVAATRPQRAWGLARSIRSLCRHARSVRCGNRAAMTAKQPTPPSRILFPPNVHPVTRRGRHMVRVMKRCTPCCV